jgi:hypothetical protein
MSYNLRSLTNKKLTSASEFNVLGTKYGQKLNYPLPEEENEDIPALTSYPKKIRPFIMQCWSIIRTHCMFDDVFSIYHFRIKNNFTYELFADLLWAIFYHQDNNFKFNVGFSYILQSIPSYDKKKKREYRLFTANLNAPNLFDTPVPILKRRVDQMFNAIANLFILNPLTQIYSKRENTKWELNCLTNVSVIVYYFH